MYAIRSYYACQIREFVRLLGVDVVARLGRGRADRREQRVLPVVRFDLHQDGPPGPDRARLEAAQLELAQTAEEVALGQGQLQIRNNFV